MTYVLVTGFAGAYIVDELLRHGHRVRVMVRKTRRTSSLDHLDVRLCYADLGEK